LYNALTKLKDNITLRYNSKNDLCCEFCVVNNATELYNKIESITKKNPEKKVDIVVGNDGAKYVADLALCEDKERKNISVNNLFLIDARLNEEQSKKICHSIFKNVYNIHKKGDALRFFIQKTKHTNTILDIAVQAEQNFYEYGFMSFYLDKMRLFQNKQFKQYYYAMAIPVIRSTIDKLELQPQDLHVIDINIKEQKNNRIYSGTKAEAIYELRASTETKCSQLSLMQTFDLKTKNVIYKLR
jgi:hypothetical protein